MAVFLVLKSGCQKSEGYSDGRIPQDKSGGDFMIFDISLILLTVLLTSAGSFAIGAAYMRGARNEKKKSDGWEGILNYDHKRGGDGH